MADPISIKIDQSAVDEIKSLVKSIQKEANTAVYKSINKGVKQTQTLAVKRIYDQIAKKTADIKAETNIAPYANANSLFAKLTISGDPKGIEFYGAKILKSGAVSFKIWKSGTTQKYRHAWIRQKDASKPAGERQYFMRDINAGGYDGRLPMRRKYGPSMSSVFRNTPGIEDDVTENAGAVMTKELARQLSLLLGLPETA